MRSMPAAVRARLRTELRAARATADVDRSWRHLESAHVLSQPWAWPHVRVHAAMLTLALRTGHRAEVRGQLLRLLLAGPGSVAGRYPLGNTGRSSVPATLPMPVPAELAELLAEGR